MFITNVRFPSLSEPHSREGARELFLQGADDYLTVPGLLLKAYVRSDDGTVIGGTYWWKDRESAQSKFNPGWLAGVTEKYGAEPTVEYVEALVVVDPRSGKIHTEAPNG